MASPSPADRRSGAAAGHFDQCSVDHPASNHASTAGKPADGALAWQGREEDGVAPDPETETFIALKAGLDNWRWADVPFYLHTGKRMAEGLRIISITFKETPWTMFLAGSGWVPRGRPPHLRPRRCLTDLLSFYGKCSGPGNAAGEALHAVLHPGDRLGGRRDGGLRDPHPARAA